MKLTFSCLFQMDMHFLLSYSLTKNKNRLPHLHDFAYALVVQRITKLMVRIILRILSHGSDRFSDQQKKVV